MGNSKKKKKFSKGEQFNQTFWKFQEENQMELKFPVRNLRKSRYSSGAFHCIKSSGTIERKTNGTKRSLERFPENPKIAEFLKCEQFNRKFGQYRQ